MKRIITLSILSLTLILSNCGPNVDENELNADGVVQEADALEAIPDGSTMVLSRDGENAIQLSPEQVEELISIEDEQGELAASEYLNDIQNDSAGIGAIVGGCVPMTNPHINRMHVGRNDAMLRAGAIILDGWDGSWRSRRDASLGVSQNVAINCDRMLRWMQGARLGQSGKWKAYTSVSGRVCSDWGDCKTTYANEVVYKKVARFALWNAMIIVTAYPVPQ